MTYVPYSCEGATVCALTPQVAEKLRGSFGCQNFVGSFPKKVFFQFYVRKRQCARQPSEDG